VQEEGEDEQNLETIRKKTAKIPMEINFPTKFRLTCKMNPWFEEAEDIAAVHVRKINILVLHHL
jgi:hypothetical protein